jgi:hypothetical protein
MAMSLLVATFIGRENLKPDIATNQSIPTPATQGLA